MFKKGLFSFDDIHFYEGYYFYKEGFVCWYKPFFTREIAYKIAEDINTNYKDASIDVENGGFVFTSNSPLWFVNNPITDKQTNVSFYPECKIRSILLFPYISVYPIGDNWTWYLYTKKEIEGLPNENISIYYMNLTKEI